MRFALLPLPFKKVFVIVAMISVFSFSAPQEARAQYVDVAAAAKEIGDSITYTAMQRMLSKLTAQTVNWINSGFKGSPAYVTNPERFFLEVSDQVASDLLSKESLNSLCSPFKAQVRIALVKSYLDETDGRAHSCTLGILEQNYNRFINDFSQGGWSNWFVLTQTDQNNPYGAYLERKNQLAIQINSKQEIYSKQLDWGKGFLSWEKCVRYGGDRSKTEFESEEEEREEEYQRALCVEKQTVTPGSVINDQLSRSLGTSWERLQAADEINEVIGALVNQLIDRAIGGVWGLFGSNRSNITQERSFTEDLQNESVTPPTTGVTAPPLAPPLYSCDGGGNCVVNTPPADVDVNVNIENPSSSQGPYDQQY